MRAEEPLLARSALTHPMGSDDLFMAPNRGANRRRRCSIGPSIQRRREHTVRDRHPRDDIFLPCPRRHHPARARCRTAAAPPRHPLPVHERAAHHLLPVPRTRALRPGPPLPTRLVQPRRHADGEPLPLASPPRLLAPPGHLRRPRLCLKPGRLPHRLDHESVSRSHSDAATGLQHAGATGPRRAPRRAPARRPRARRPPHADADARERHRGAGQPARAGRWRLQRPRQRTVPRRARRGRVLARPRRVGRRRGARRRPARPVRVHGQCRRAARYGAGIRLRASCLSALGGEGGGLLALHHLHGAWVRVEIERRGPGQRCIWDKKRLGILLHLGDKGRLFILLGIIYWTLLYLYFAYRGGLDIYTLFSVFFKVSTALS